MLLTFGCHKDSSVYHGIHNRRVKFTIAVVALWKNYAL